MTEILIPGYLKNIKDVTRQMSESNSRLSRRELILGSLPLARAITAHAINQSEDLRVEKKTYYLIALIDDMENTFGA